MIAQGLARSYLLELLRGLHAENHTYRMALYTRDANLSEDTTAYTTDGEVSGRDSLDMPSGYKPGGLTLSGFNAILDRGIACLSFANPVWPNATITARGALIYNLSAQNRAVGIIDLGRDFISTNGSFSVKLPELTAKTALIRIGKFNG